MKRATENKGNTRALSEYFSPKSKVKDLSLQQCSLPHVSSFLQETPMKPSQVPNQLPYPAPRRMLPLQSPELCHRDRLGPPRHPPPHQGPFHSPGFVPSSPTNISYSVNRPHLTPRDRLGPLHHSVQPPGFYSSQLFPVSPISSGTTPNRPQPPPPGIFHPASPQFMKDLSNHPSSSHIRRDQVTESKVALSYSGSKNVTAQRQESNKSNMVHGSSANNTDVSPFPIAPCTGSQVSRVGQVQSSDVRSSIPTVQLHRPPMIPSVNTGVPQEVYPLPHSDSEPRSPGNSQCPPKGYQPSQSTHSSDRSSTSSLPIMHSPVAPRQDLQYKRTPSSENLIPAVDLNYLTQKRRVEFEDCGSNTKKLCLQGENSGKAQTPKPAVCSSLGTSLVSQPSLGHSSVLELSPKTTDALLCTEPVCGESTYLEPSSTFKPIQSSCASLTPKSCLKKRPPTGAKQAFMNASQNTAVIELRSPTKLCEESLKKKSEENDKRDKSNSLLYSEVPQKDTGSLPHFQSGSHHSGHSHCSTSVLPVRTPSRKSDSSTPKPASKPNTGSLGCRTEERNKLARSRKHVVVPDNIDDLFTPDPLTYVVSPSHKTAKPKIDGVMVKSGTSEKPCSSSTVSSSSTTVTGSSCCRTQNITATGSPHSVDTKVSPACNPQVSLPTITLERVKLENLRSFAPKDSKPKKSPVTSSGRQCKDESVKSEQKHSPPVPNNVRPCTVDTQTVASEETSASHCSQSPLLEMQAVEEGRTQVNEEDPIDVELDLGLSFALDLDLTQSTHSNSSEEEQLLSLQEMMDHVIKLPDTPEKGAFSEPSTPGHHSCPSKTQPLPSTTKTGIYKNNLDQMLMEINHNKRAKEIETQLLTACKEDLLRIAEYEEAEENREEGISTEHQEFLQRYSLMSSAIREVPPGEVVFNLEKFGRIFSHDTLQLRQCMVNPQGTAQKTLLWSSPAQLRLHANIGLFQEAYDCHSPCPAQVTRFLFKMMSVHSEMMVSEKILQALCDIACTAAYQIVENESQEFKVWVPSLANVTLVLMNMGVAFVSLFPFEDLQPPFTEGDLLEDIYMKCESPSSNKEQSCFPEHNCSNILKYLSYCMGLCPKAYSDDELLLLLTVVGRVGLDTRLILQSSVELYPLQYKIVNNIRDWETMMPRICLALTDLTDDHHNMCFLVQLLPDNTRGKQLRRHLSLSMISKLLDGHCTYRPKEEEILLSDLRPYLPRMQPSTLLRGMLNSCNRSQKEKEDMATLDQQSYYLCYSLLTLANEASNFQFFPAHQKAQLLILCAELETHVKCDIRESEKCLYRSKVKDLVARIYTKWQMLLQRTRPLHGKLYDYWQPLLVDPLTSNQEEQEIGNDNDGEEPVMKEDDEDAASGTEENEGVMIAEDKEKGDRDDAMDENKETEDNAKPEEMASDDTMDNINETEEAKESVHGELKGEMLEMEPQVQKEPQVMEEPTERVEVDTENLVETGETP